ncbi:ABC-three component system middle component 5 [Thiomicrospira sp. WB1]|uniref:ABC-three component system middle component 5 n=1 Tax=Thiomicrospira sp. WB1 TaxID=1685380 RepID=UPI00128FBA89|nr:ABC-three component system middle component 5 [Thiomicrospira sp. WB1]
MTRIWYPQLDIYHAIRRIAALLYFWEKKTAPLERLYIFDFYFANPPLLHNVHMPADVRETFKELVIQKPEKTFLTYPTPSILFHKMESIQKKAVQAMVAKNLLSSEALHKGKASLSSLGEEFVESRVVGRLSEKDAKLIEFLARSFSQVAEGDSVDLRKRTGLRRMV